jgi:RimJ/RimL family protein N-acetyltransferase
MSIDDPILTDGVVRLQDWDPTDAEWYAATAGQDELIQRFTAESPSVTPEEVRAAVTNLAGQPNAVGFLICDAVTGQRYGNISLRHEAGIGHVSYWLAATARGRGHASRALQLVSRLAFDQLGLDQLRLWTHVDNVASRHVAERAGFRRDPERDQQKQVKGTTWDTIAYALSPPARDQKADHTRAP